MPAVYSLWAYLFLFVIFCHLTSCNFQKTTYYWSNGNPYVKGAYKDAMRNAKWKSWNEHGTIVRKGTFREGCPVGLWKEYNEGNRHEIGNYTALDCFTKSFDQSNLFFSWEDAAKFKDSLLAANSDWINLNDVVSERYSRLYLGWGIGDEQSMHLGSLASRTILIKEGKWKFYDETGKVISTRYFDNGKPRYGKQTITILKNRKLVSRMKYYENGELIMKD